jgi:hypothetical protein
LTGATLEFVFEGRDNIKFQSAPRPIDRGDRDLPNWPSRKDFVTHFRKPASFSCVSDL